MTNAEWPAEKPSICMMEWEWLPGYIPVDLIDSADWPRSPGVYDSRIGSEIGAWAGRFWSNSVIDGKVAIEPNVETFDDRQCAKASEMQILTGRPAAFGYSLTI